VLFWVIDELILGCQNSYQMSLSQLYHYHSIYVLFMWSGRWVSSGYSVIFLHKDHMKANIDAKENDLY